MPSNEWIHETFHRAVPGTMRIEAFAKPGSIQEGLPPRIPSRPASLAIWIVIEEMRLATWNMLSKVALAKLL